MLTPAQKFTVGKKVAEYGTTVAIRFYEEVSRATAERDD